MRITLTKNISIRKLILTLLFFLILADSFAFKSDSIDTFLDTQIKTITTICNQQPDFALTKATYALKIANETENEKVQAELLRLIGLIWYYKVDYAKSLDYFSKSHELFVQLKDKDGEASALNNISLVYRTQGFLDKALEMDQKVLEMRKQLGNLDKLAASYNNMAVAYLDSKNYDAALFNYHEAITLSIKNNHLESLDLYYNNIGNLYFEIGLLDSAYYYFQKSLTFSIPLNHKQMISNSYIYLGQYFLQTQEYGKAKYYLEKGLRLAKEIGIVYEIEDAAKFLHEAYYNLQEYENAYNAHVLFKEMADSAKNIETIQKITEIESELKYKKERELDQIKQDNKQLADQLEINKQKQARNFAILVGIVLSLIALFSYINYKNKSRDNKELLAQKDKITKQKEEIQKQRDKIQALNSTKDRFFAIIAHDLRNPLGGIYKLSEVVYTNLDYLSHEKLEKYLLNIKTTSEGVYTLLDNLLHWATIQSGSLTVKCNSFNLNTVILENIDLLTGLAIQKNITIEFTEVKDSLAFADQEMINTVVRNLMTNAIKFTPEKGKVAIKLMAKENFWEVAVSDTGIGISEEDQKQLFQLMPESKTIGRSKEKGIGLGLILCREFVTRNGGKIWLESELGSGTKFYISVPKFEA